MKIYPEKYAGVWSRYYILGISQENIQKITGKI
jgi:hypothetical protein